MGLGVLHMQAGCHIRSCTESFPCISTSPLSKLSTRKDNPSDRTFLNFSQSSRKYPGRSVSPLQGTRGVQLVHSSSSRSVPPTMAESPSSLTPTKGENNSAEEAFYPPQFRLLFVEMGVGYDQHGQDVTSAAVKACKNAITSNSIPAFRTGALPGVNYTQMKLLVKLGVPHAVQSQVDIQKVKAVFPYGEILRVDIADGGLLCSSGVALEAMGDKNDDCYVVNAAVYIGY